MIGIIIINEFSQKGKLTLYKIQDTGTYFEQLTDLPKLIKYFGQSINIVLP